MQTQNTLNGTAPMHGDNINDNNGASIAESDQRPASRFVADLAIEPEAEGTPKRTRRRHDIVADHYLDSLTFAGKVVGLVMQPDFPALEGISLEFLTQLSKDVDSAISLVTKVETGATGRKILTKEGRAARSALLVLMRKIRDRAYQKHRRTNRAILRNYGVGVSINQSLSRLLQVAHTAADSLATDVLPGVNAAMIAALNAAIDSCSDTEGSRCDQRADTTTRRAEMKQLVASIDDRRREIQAAVSAQFPAHDPLSVGIRREFGLRVSVTTAPS